MLTLRQPYSDELTNKNKILLILISKKQPANTADNPINRRYLLITKKGKDFIQNTVFKS